jgi:hypothetical protein
MSCSFEVFFTACGRPEMGRERQMDRPERDRGEHRADEQPLRQADEELAYGAATADPSGDQRGCAGQQHHLGQLAGDEVDGGKQKARFAGPGWAR